MKKIHLFDFYSYSGLIIPCKSGVTYVNQSSGILCDQLEQEGVFVPFPMEDAMKDRFENYEGFGSFGPSDADFLDANVFRPDITVDRELLDKSTEAWVYVNISPDFAFFCGEWPNGSKGIFVWDNSY